VRSFDDSIKAAQAQVQSVKDLEQYLTLKAPFDGVITERDVHPGALVGPGTGSTPLLKLHQISRLRLIVAVPEALVGAMVKGARVAFTGAGPSRRNVLWRAEPHGTHFRREGAPDHLAA
jgi:multidrug efflux pump subunit AcrA (membrane-fusion protein)